MSADLWILNSCTVKNPAEDHFRNEIKQAQALGKYIVAAGCVPQGQPKSEYIKVREREITLVCTGWLYAIETAQVRVHIMVLLCVLVLLVMMSIRLSRS